MGINFLINQQVKNKMTIGHQDNSELSGSFDKPFVCHYYPNISSTADQSIPIVVLKMPTVRNSWCQSGFTVVELMITLVVAAILFGIAIPNLRTFIQNARMTAQSNEIVGDIALARSEAIKRNKTVVVCRSSNPTATTPTCGGAGTWETGWITFVDDAPEDSTYSVGETLIRQHDALSSGTTVVASDATLANVIVFAGSGLLSGLATTLDTKPFFQICDGRGTSYARAIVFETTGRAHIAQQSGLPGGFACP